MKTIPYAILACALLLLSAFTVLEPIDWKIADGYAIRFSSKEPSGVFTKFSGNIVFDANHPENSSFNLLVDVTSINTGNGMKNKHAKSDEWLNAALYPEITFVSSAFSKNDKGYEVTGILSLHGVKKEISIPFTFANDTFAGNFTVNRLDYNIGDTKGMSGKVSTDLKIDFTVPVTKQ